MYHHEAVAYQQCSGVFLLWQLHGISLTPPALYLFRFPSWLYSAKSLAETTHIQKNIPHHIYAEGLGQSHVSSLVLGSVSVSFYKNRVVDYLCFLVMSLTPLAPTVLPLTLQWNSHSFP